MTITKTLADQILNQDTINNLPQPKTDLSSILNILFAVIGALAFLMIVVGGFRYVIAAGNAERVAGAKKTITYAAAGLVVVGLAATIVNFVLGRL